ncbi:hypothetical protein V8N76_004507 [Salmonella enterica]
MDTGLTPEQRSNSFSDNDLRMMITGDNPQSNAWRELLAYRRLQSLPAYVLPPELTERDETGQYLLAGMRVLPTWARGYNACLAEIRQTIADEDTPLRMPPHHYSKLVNDLRDTALKYAHAQQLRAQISHTLEMCGVVPDHRF